MGSLARQIEDAVVLRTAIDELDVGVAAWNATTTQLLAANALGRRLAGALDSATLAAAGRRLDAADTVELTLTQHGGGRVRVHLRLGISTRGDRLVVASFHELDDDAAAISERLGLKRRERQIVALVLAGLRNREIAERLGVAEGTVKQYMNRIFGALEVRSRAELILRLTRGSY